MRIDHLTGSITTQGGGIPIALYSLLLEQRRIAIRPRLLGWDDGGEGVGDWPEGILRALPFGKRLGLPAALGMRKELSDGSPDLIHLHGLWTDASRVTCNSGQRYLVSPHGMLDPWALRHSAWKKWLAGRWFERRCLGGASCLHALCQSEADSMRIYGLRNPIAIIPNGINLPDLADNRPSKSDDQAKVLLFLGRLHPKKGLGNALRAWSSHSKFRIRNSTSDDWKFVIAGWDQGGHRLELENLCRELGLSVARPSVEQFLADPTAVDGASVVFTGPTFGPQKEDLFRRAFAFILPSFSEGLPMSVLEAWSYSLPVLMTDQCNLPEGFQSEAAIRIGTAPPTLSEGLVKLFAATPSELKAIGHNGRLLVERRFTWPQVARQMKELYDWVLGGGERPSFVEK